MSIEFYLKLHHQHQQLKKIRRNSQPFLLAQSQIKNNCFREKNREIVVARYLETPDWSLPYKSMTTIYNKKYKPGDMEYIDYSGPVLKNVGRESHTYLTHIVKKWNTLKDYTFFAQGELDPAHVPYPLETYFLKEDFICNPNMKGITFKDRQGGFIKHTGKWLEEYNAGWLRPAKLPLDQWWRTYLQIPEPDCWSKLSWSHGALFSVSRKRIQQFDRSYYERLLSTVSDDVNPEEGHYFERAWYSLFSYQKND